MRSVTGTSLVAALLTLTPQPRAEAFDLGRGWSLELRAATVLQCPTASTGVADERCGAAALVQPEILYRPAQSHAFGAKLGFARGNGLAGSSPFVAVPWAADLEADVRNINGGGRDHVLTAWYRYCAESSGGDRLQVTAGILDGTDYLDGNAYANDEFTQFLNGAFVNAPNGFVPSYEPGVAAQWDTGPWSLRGVYMRPGPADSGSRFHYFGAEAGRAVHNSLGPATLRLTLQQTSEHFEAVRSPGRAARRSWLVSADQTLGDGWGLWLRAGLQSGDTAIEFRSLYSAGAEVQGQGWGRPMDRVGVGIALARGGNLGIDEARIAEAYYRAEPRPWLAATLDLQYLRQSYRDGGRASAWIAGLRLVLSY